MFYQSKKFQYALITVIGAALVAVLPTVLGDRLSPDTLEMLSPILYAIIGLGVFVISGHEINDAITLIKGIQSKSLEDALHDLIEAFSEDSEDFDPAVFVEDLSKVSAFVDEFNKQSKNA